LSNEIVSLDLFLYITSKTLQLSIIAYSFCFIFLKKQATLYLFSTKIPKRFHGISPHEHDPLALSYTVLFIPFTTLLLHSLTVIGVWNCSV